jgi:beta-mannosidase
MVHLANMTLDDPYYSFRISQDLDPITDLFGEMPKTIEDITLYAQIAGAEANKYFLERMRIRKDKKRGIMLWNMAEGWPELCEAFVDYYYRLKLAYYYVKQSQQPLCMMMDETEEGVLLGLVNDTPNEETVRYKVTNALTGEILYAGESTVAANGLVNVLYDDRKERTFYNIEWETLNGKGQNHFISQIQGVNVSDYIKALQNCGCKVTDLINRD